MTTIRPLNEYYVLKVIEEPKKAGLLLTLDAPNKPIRLASVIAVPKDNELELRPGADTVYVQQHYGHEVEDDLLLIKQDYILAEYIDK